MTINFNNYQAVLTNAPSEINKRVIDDWSKEYKYYYDIQNDVFYNMEDLYDFCE